MSTAFNSYLKHARTKDLAPSSSTSPSSRVDHLFFSARPRLSSSSSTPALTTTSSSETKSVVATLASPSVLESQMSDAMKQIMDALNAASLTVNDVYFVHFFLADIKDFAVANTLYTNTFPIINPASRCTVEAPLPDGIRVGIDIVAYRQSRTVLHVQSISEWAPCCIGPYSQATRIGSILYLAGQIGLEPASMTLRSTNQDQCQQSIWNCQQVLTALGYVVTTCYVLLVAIIDDEQLDFVIVPILVVYWQRLYLLPKISWIM
jgi:enamine deaminase RidA (YjgF/YER057c/UK114 family)